MNASELRAEVRVEIAHMDRVISELIALRSDVGPRTPTLREVTAAGAFLSSFYSGVESILKRISKHHGVPLPTGDQWHVALLDRFREPSSTGLPLLVPDALARDLDAYRRFRHVVRASYGIELDWSKISTGIDGLHAVSQQFLEGVASYLDDLV